MINVYLQGNTIRLTAIFKDMQGILFDPDSVIFKTYNSHYIQLGTDVTASRVSLGTYKVEYTIPLDQCIIYYEFKGSVGGQIALQRGQFNAVFVQ